MEKQALHFGEAVSIVWRDSASFPGWRVNTENLHAGEVVTLGYVMGTTETELIVSTSIGSQGGALDPLVIPWSAVESVKRLPELGI